MAYAVEADLNLSDVRLIELTDSEAAPGVKDSALLTRLEAEAEGIVDAHIAGVVTLPLSPVPPIIKAITAWIWAYRVYRHRETMETPKDVVDDYEMALRLLEKIASSGAIALGIPTQRSSNAPDISSQEKRGWTD